MAIEIGTAYVSLVVSAEGILDNIRTELAPLDDAFAAAGLSAGAALGTNVAAQLQSALADAFAQPLDTSALVDEAGIAASIDAGVTSADPPPLVLQGDTTGLDAAITDATSVVPDLTVDGDTSALTGAIDDATGITADVPLSADASELIAVIDAATADTQIVPVGADTSQAEDAIGALSGNTVDVIVDADTADAQDSIDALGSSASGASGDVGGLTGAVTGFKGVAGLARGETEGLTAGIASISKESAAGVGGLTAFGAVIGESISLAADAQAQNQRFADTFGDVADKVRQIDVGGLKISLQDLGKESGTTNADLEASATRIGLLGQAAGAARPAVAGTTSDLLGIAGALSVSNPRLGDAATVADTLSRAFSTGRTRSLIPYGISLSQNAITQEALRENVGKTAAELTGYDKIVAGVTLTQQQFGDTLGTKFAQGAQNAQIQLRAMKVEIEETLVAVGGPLLTPFVTSLQAAVPVAEELGLALGNLAQATLPLIADLAPVLIPVAGAIGLVADGLGVLASAVDALPTPVVVAGLVLVGPAAIAAASGIDIFAVSLDAALGPVGIVLSGLALIGTAVDVFGSKGPSVAATAKTMSDALFGAGVGAGSLASQVINLDTDLDKFAGQLLSSTGALGAFAPVFAAFGGGAKGLSDALSGSDATFKSYESNLEASARAAGLGSLAIDLLNQGLDKQRQALIADETGQIRTLVQTNKVTQAQVDAAEKTVIAKDGYLDLADVLKILSGEADSADAAQQQLTLSSSVASGALRDAIAAFDPATSSAADYTAKLVALGVSQADADQLLKDQTGALQAQTDKTVLASSAVTQLDLAFVSGNIGAGQLEGGVFALGTSLAAAQGNVSDLQKNIDSFAKSAVGALPNVGTAVSDFGSGVTKAFGDVASAAGKSPKEVADAQSKLRAALNPQGFIDDLGREASSIANFQHNLTTLVSEGLGDLAGVIAAKGPEVGGQLAAVFASDHTKAVAAEGAVGLVNTATANFQGFASGPAAAAAMGAGGTALANAANAGYAQHFALEHPTQSQVDSAKLIIQQAEPGLTGVSQGLARAGVVAFEAEFGRLPTVAEVQAGKTQIALDSARGPLSASAAGTGKAATDAFGGGLDISGKTTSQVAASQSAWDGQATIDTGNSARRAGIGVGFQFDQGIAEGIGNGLGNVEAAASNAAGAAATAAKARLHISSPSQVGVEIGGQFIAGISLGVSDTVGLTAVAGDSARAVSVAFSAALAQTPLVITPTVDQSAFAASLSTITKPVTLAVDAAPGLGTFGDPTQIAQANQRLQELITTEQQQSQATAATDAATQALQQFISTAISALPTAATAIQSFNSTLAQAMGQVASAHQAVSAAQSKFDADQAKLKGNVVTAQQQFDSDAKAGASQRQLFLDQKKIDDAKHALTVQTLLDTKALQDANAALGTSQKARDAASDPQSFIAELTVQNRSVKGFAHDLQVLTGEGLTGLAQYLAAQGPAVAKGLADALGRSPKDARVAEALIDANKKLSAQFGTSLADEFSTQDFGKVGVDVGLQIGQGAAKGLTDTGDVLFTALTAPLTKKVANVPVRLNAEGAIPVGTATSINARIPDTTIGPFTFPIEINIDGQVVHATATVPAAPLNPRASFSRVLADARAR